MSFYNFDSFSMQMQRVIYRIRFAIILYIINFYRKYNKFTKVFAKG